MITLKTLWSGFRGIKCSVRKLNWKWTNDELHKLKESEWKVVDAKFKLAVDEAVDKKVFLKDFVAAQLNAKTTTESEESADAFTKRVNEYYINA